MDNTTDLNVTYPTLELLNREETKKMLPILVFYVIVMVVGLIGNALVIAVYTHRLKHSSARWYILSLAALDFLVCLVGIPYHLLDLTFQFTYTFIYVCKSLSLLMSVLNFGSVFILNVVAIDRYFKVCRPLKKQVVDFGARKACLLAFIVAALVAWPNGVLYGQSSVETRIKDFYGTQCFYDDFYEDTWYPLIFQGVTLLCFLITIAFLIVVYYLIWRQIYRSSKGQTLSINSNRSWKTRCCCCNYGIDDEEEDDDEDENENSDDEAASVHDSVEMEVKNGEKSNDANEQEKNEAQGEESALCTSAAGTGTDSTKSRKKEKRESSNKTSKRKAKQQSKKKPVEPLSSMSLVRHKAPGAKAEDNQSRKITIMMFTITVVFITSYLPFILFSLADALDDELWDDITYAESLLFEIILRTYLFNNIANPIIYGFWDLKFRRECKRLLRKLFCCGTKKKKDFHNTRSTTDQKSLSCPTTKSDYV